MSDPYITLEGGEDRGWTDGSWGCNSCELPDCSSGIRLPLYARRRCTHRFVSSYFIVFACIFDNRPLCSVYLRLSVNNIGIKQKDPWPLSTDFMKMFSRKIIFNKAGRQRYPEIVLLLVNVYDRATNIARTGLIYSTWEQLLYSIICIRGTM